MSISANFSLRRPAGRCLRRALCLTALCSVVLSAATAQATLLSEWNLLVRNNLTTYSHIDGSTKVGGNVTSGAGVFSMHLVTAPNGDGLAVGGNITGNLHINSGGNLRLGGTNTGSVNFNGGGTTVLDSSVASSVASDFAYLASVSAAFSALTPNGTLDGGGNLNATPTLIDGQRVAVYSLNAASFGSLGQLNLNFGSADTVIINVSGTNVNFQAPPNLIGGFNQGNSTRILWNLPEATLVTTNNTFNGALLALNADLQIYGGGINGTVAVNSLSYQNSEIRRFNYTGYLPPVPVPEPSSGLLLALAGVALVGWKRYAGKRRRV